MPRTSDPSRDLLFGLLALQNGLIDQGALFAAFAAWTRDKERPLAEHLVGPGDLDPEQRAAVEALVALHLKKHGGDSEKSLAAVPVAPSIRRSLAAVADPPVDTTLVGLVFGPDDEGDPDRTASYSVGAATSDGQRFRILRPHARGGLGAIFVALDSELHREVALKQILDSHADDPESRRRFLLEAEVTGGLEHPGIVPVYGLGIHPDGRPYYAMRFIKGDSLKDAIATFHADETLKGHPGRRSLELRKLLHRFLDVCNAIEFAHSRGVVHRDIKPSNVVLGKHGETLVVDWGLAKALGRAESSSGSDEQPLVPSSSSGSAETLPGSALGTPAYMSPEQAAGELDRLGPQSDVYSLGATLYCLLTGRPPFAGEAVDVLRAVGRGDFPSARTLDPTIDPALEAVCLKAMALRPEGRYGSPKALAEDLERWMADEPVSAWREPLSRRARRWRKRNRSLVIAAAAAGLVASIGAAGLAMVEAQSNRALGAKNAELAQAQAQVQARFGLAQEAIRAFHTAVTGDPILNQEEFRPLRNRLLRGAIVFYRRLEDLLKDETGRPSRAALAQAYHDIGELTAEIGSQAEALTAHRRALEIRLALAAGSGAETAPRRDAANSLIAVGDLQEATGELAGALDSFKRARELLEPMVRSQPNEPSDRAAVARCLRGIARVEYDQGRVAEALASHKRARSIFHGLVEAFPGVAEFQGGLAASDYDIARIQRITGHVDDALSAYQDALVIRQKLAAADPASAQYQSDLATTHNYIGGLQMETDRPAEALASLERSRAIFQALADANPAVTQFQGDLAHSHLVIGGAQRKTGHQAEAMESFERARAILQKLVTFNPGNALVQFRLAYSHASVGQCWQEAGRIAEAAAEFRRALAIGVRLCEIQPDGHNLYNLACYRSMLSGLADRPGSGLTAEDIQILRAQAVSDLRRAIAAGSRDLAFMRKDPDIDALRSRPDFQMLIMDLAFPEEPFAH